MLPFRRIVFPVDFSDACKAVVPYANDMRKRFDAGLTLVHAFVPAPLIVGEFGSVSGAGYPGYEPLRAAEKERLNQFAAEMFPGLPVDLVMEDGEPGQVVVDQVRRNGADLVMLPTRGHGAFRRFLLGSTAAKILHDVSCAVWTGVHRDTPDHDTHLPYRNILCAVSSDDDAKDVMHAASVFAAQYAANLEVVHAVETPPMAWEVDYTPYRQSLMNAAEEHLRRMQRQLGLEVPIHVIEGSPTYGIHDLALEKRTDLLIVGRGHAQGAVSRVWSHLYSIIRESPCPVLSV